MTIILMTIWSQEKYKQNRNVIECDENLLK